MDEKKYILTKIYISLKYLASKGGRTSNLFPYLQQKHELQYNKSGAAGWNDLFSYLKTES